MRHKTIIIATTYATMLGIPAAHAATWNAAGSNLQNICAPTGMGANVIGGGCNTPWSSAIEEWSGSASNDWTEITVDQTTTITTTNDWHGGVWAVIYNANCPGNSGHVNWISWSATYPHYRAQQLDSANPQCVIAMAAGNTCTNGGGAGCTDNGMIYAIGANNDILEWDPSMSEWLVLNLFPNGSPQLKEIAVFDDDTAECDGGAAVIPDLWVMESPEVGEEVYQSTWTTYRGYCLRGNMTVNNPDLFVACIGDAGYAGVYGLTTDYALCSGDLVKWTGSSWQAQNVGGCPNGFSAGAVQYGLFPQIGYYPGSNVMCWSAGGYPTSTQAYYLQ